MANINKKRIGENISVLAKWYGFKIKEIEDEAGVSQGYISRLSNSNGKDSNPIIDLLMVASEKFRVTIDSLVNVDFKKLAKTEKRDIQRFLDGVQTLTDKELLLWKRNKENGICDEESQTSFVCEYDENITFYIFKLDPPDDEYPGYSFYIANKPEKPSLIAKYYTPGPVVYDNLENLFETAAAEADYVNIDKSAEYAISKFFADNKSEIKRDDKSKYKPLEDFLKQCTESDIVKTLYEIEEIIGAELPKSAWYHQTFWANNSKDNSSHSKAWLDAGYEVVDAYKNTIEHRVHFRKKDTKEEIV